MRTARELCEARQRLKMRFSDVARKTGVPIDQLVAIESGEPEVLPSPAVLKKILPVLAAELGLDGSKLTRRYLLELHYLLAPELSGTVEAGEKDGATDADQGAVIDENVGTFAPQPVQELALATDPARAVAPDLPLHAPLGDQLASAAPLPSAAVPRRRSYRGVAMVVSAGFVIGLLCTAVILKGVPPSQ